MWFRETAIFYKIKENFLFYFIYCGFAKQQNFAKLRGKNIFLILDCGFWKQQ